MTWTVIYRDPAEESCLTTEVFHGIWGSKEAITFIEKKIKSDVLAIVAGDQVIHFNDPVVTNLLS